MVSLWSLASATLLIARAANAHFTLTSPSPIGTFDEDEEDNAPCGGYTPDFSSQTPTDFHVGGDSIVTLSTHPQTTWLYRITTDETANGNWSEIYPIWLQSGQGTMCIPSVIINESYVGQKVVLSVVGNGPDGILYQACSISIRLEYSPTRIGLAN
ncbi:uncharacterized protein BCR38DRAFT_65835 [Pseudomassariella vexata]|uniref:Copper acquisition factor BIM1-like domain-containing protein n=1 Tax=Pseudomassariella vexata TaxID=1141098 RepID=A0A1Y2DIW9_9PEZI|nr:uncharacterized protein BCR38DRAFT_65835 [Pseudomassariella vexata]ORY59173.1 hypothetical protein BCR38DRAFT_65835 [Pseudomassariella vexata]